MSDSDPLGAEVGAEHPPPAMYALSAVVYAERGDEILLLKRAEGTALAGQYFLPGGLVEPGELPEEGARRELMEEAGVEIAGELELVGCYPMHVYGHDMLQLSFRGVVAARRAPRPGDSDRPRPVFAAGTTALTWGVSFSGCAR